MKIHEYQGKQVLREYGVPTPRGFPAMSVDEALKLLGAGAGSGGAPRAASGSGDRQPSAATNGALSCAGPASWASSSPAERCDPATR